MMKRLKLVFVACVVSMSVMSGLHGRMLDAMIFTGMSEEDFGAMTIQFSLALCQKSTPCIVSSSLLHNFLECKFKTKPVLKLLPISDSDWDIYINSYRDIYLFIPKDYVKTLNAKFDTEQLKKAAGAYPQYTPADILIGFNTKALTKISAKELHPAADTPEAVSELLKTVKKQVEFDVKHLEELFVQGTDDIFGLWNFMLSGHGMYPDNVDFSQKQAQEIDVSGARIADLTIKQYRDWIQFLIKSIKTNFLYVLSCYGGDYNLILPYMTTLINKGVVVHGIQKPNFTVAIGSLTSRVVTLGGGSLADCLLPAGVDLKAKSNVVNFKDFFKYLHTGEDATHAVIYKNQELKQVLTQVTPRVREPHDPYGLSALPQIMFPGSDIFRAVALDDAIAVITEVLTKKHAIEKKPFVLVDKEAILVYPREIPVEMTIESSVGKHLPVINSMKPGIGLHKFESLSCTVRFKKFIAESFGTFVPVFNKYFYIKELTLLNDEYCIKSLPQDSKIVLNNVWIFQQVYKQETIMVVNVVFTYANNIYSYQYESSIGGEPKEPAFSQRDDEIKVTNFFPDPFINSFGDYFIHETENIHLKYKFQFGKLNNILSKDEHALIEQYKKGPVIQEAKAIKAQAVEEVKEAVAVGMQELPLPVPNVPHVNQGVLGKEQEALKAQTNLLEAYLFKPEELKALQLPETLHKKAEVTTADQVIGKIVYQPELTGASQVLATDRAQKEGWGFDAANTFERGEIVLVPRSNKTYTYGVVGTRMVPGRWINVTGQLLHTREERWFVQLDGEQISKPILAKDLGKWKSLPSANEQQELQRVEQEKIRKQAKALQQEEKRKAEEMQRAEQERLRKQAEELEHQEQELKKETQRVEQERLRKQTKELQLQEEKRKAEQEVQRLEQEHQKELQRAERARLQKLMQEREREREQEAIPVVPTEAIFANQVQEQLQPIQQEAPQKILKKKTMQKKVAGTKKKASANKKADQQARKADARKQKLEAVALKKAEAARKKAEKARKEAEKRKKAALKKKKSKKAEPKKKMGKKRKAMKKKAARIS